MHKSTGSFAPKTLKLKGSNSYLTPTSLQHRGRTAERCCSLPVVVQGSGSLSTISVNVFVRRMVLKLWGIKVPQFSHFCLYFQYKTPKKSLFLRGQQLHCRMLLVVVEGPEGYAFWCLPAPSVRGVGTPKFAYSSPMGNSFANLWA